MPGEVGSEVPAMVAGAAQRSPSETFGWKLGHAHRTRRVLRRVDAGHDDPRRPRIENQLCQHRIAGVQPCQKVDPFALDRPGDLVEGTHVARRVFHVDTQPVKPFSGHHFGHGRMADHHPAAQGRLTTKQLLLRVSHSRLQSV